MDSKTRTALTDNAGDGLQQQSAAAVRGSNGPRPAHDLNPLMGGMLLAQCQGAQTA